MSYNADVALLGYGISNRALGEYLSSLGISSRVITSEDGCDYLNTNEKIAFA